MTNMVPAWKVSKKAALKAWRESMGPAEAAEYAACLAATKSNAIARREAKAARDRQLVSLSLAGSSMAEISTALGLDFSTVWRNCVRLGIEPGRLGQRRVPAGWIKAEIFEALRALAAERGQSSAELLKTVLTFVFEERAHYARHLLRHDRGKAAA